jgi:hypothetical protein
MTGSRIFGQDVVVAAFGEKARTVGPRAFEITRRYGLLAQTKVRANMSGRTGVTFMPEGEEDAGPSGEIGPRAQTGDLRRSVTTETAIDGVTVRSTTGSNEPQVLRLELGFVGVDAIGRHYDQPPYPAWRPAFDALAPSYRRDIEVLAAL